MCSISTELLRVVKFLVLGIFELLNFWQNLSTVVYKPVAYKKIIVYIKERKMTYSLEDKREEKRKNICFSYLFT